MTYLKKKKKASKTCTMCVLHGCYVSYMAAKEMNEQFSIFLQLDNKSFVGVIILTA